MSDPSTQPLRLLNPVPFNGGVGVDKVSGNIPSSQFNYLFRGLLAGNPGNRQTLIALFFAKLHSKCLALNLTPCYDPDHERIVAELMFNLNFEPRPLAPDDGGSGQTPPTSPRRRRAAARPPKPE